jgi:thiamine biosynthesis protein ThiI
MDYMESKDQMTTLERIILVKYEEIFLKGDNRGFFEKRLMDNMRKALIGLGSIKISKNQGRVYVIPKESDYPVDEAVSRLAKVFGINAVSPCVCLPVDYEAVAAQAVAMAAEISETAGMTTFKVETKRADKNFPMTSMEVSANIGSRILDAVPQLKVDVNTPTFVIHLELRDKAYLYSQSVPAPRACRREAAARPRCCCPAALTARGGLDDRQAWRDARGRPFLQLPIHQRARPGQRWWRSRTSCPSGPWV